MTYTESPIAETRKTTHAPGTSLVVDTRDASGLDNAVLDSMHTSTTEAVLQWHHFDVFPSLRTDYQSIFHLERSRPALRLSQAALLPYLGDDDLAGILDAFERNLNFWYPTVSDGQLRAVRAIIAGGAPAEDSLESCLALLVMALGCASEVTSNLELSDGFTAEEAARRASRRKMGDVYFEGALKKLHVVHLSLSSTAAQCLFFIA